MNALSTHKQELLSSVGQLIEQTQGTDLVLPEDSGVFSIEDDLVKQVRSLVRQTAELMLEIMECYDAEAAGTAPSDISATDISATDDEAFLKEIGAQISSQMAVEEVSGLAFVSRGQLLDMQTAIDDAVASRHTWKVAAQTDTGLRRAGRALVAIESAIRECEGLPVEYRQWQNLDDSLEVRRIYGELRRSIMEEAGDDPETLTDDEIPGALQHAAVSLAKLRSLEIYPFLRIDDRLQIRRLQKRILKWLEHGDEGSENGASLWSDLLGFTHLLAQVNHRQEIREHDRLAVNGLFRRLFEDGDVGPLTPETLTGGLLTLLEPLLGRDDDLDHIILNPNEHNGLDLRSPLERLQKELGRPFESRPHSDFHQG